MNFTEDAYVALVTIGFCCSLLAILINPLWPH